MFLGLLIANTLAYLFRYSRLPPFAIDFRILIQYSISYSIPKMAEGNLRYPTSHDGVDNDDDNENDSSGSEGPAMPRGVVNQRRRGWQGEELEMGHQQETLRSGKHKESTVAAVDIRQFQNHVVGEGYQARHVVRQPSANPASNLQVKDMSGGAAFHHKKEKASKSDTGEREYMKNDGLREFRKEIESILASR